MPIPANAEALWRQVCRGPVEVAEFDSSPDLRFLKVHKLVELVPHPTKLSPSKHLVLTLKGEVLRKITQRAIVNAELTSWMRELGIDYPLSMLKELINEEFVEVDHTDALTYQAI